MCRLVSKAGLRLLRARRVAASVRSGIIAQMRLATSRANQGPTLTRRRGLRARAAAPVGTPRSRVAAHARNVLLVIDARIRTRSLLPAWLVTTLLLARLPVWPATTAITTRTVDAAAAPSARPATSALRRTKIQCRVLLADSRLAALSRAQSALTARTIRTAV